MRILLSLACTELTPGLRFRGFGRAHPRRSRPPHERLDCVIEYTVPVTRELEDSEIKRTGVFRFR